MTRIRNQTKISDIDAHNWKRKNGEREQRLACQEDIDQHNPCTTTMKNGDHEEDLNNVSLFLR